MCKFLRTFLTEKIYLQLCQWVNFTMTLSLFLPSWWKSSIKVGSVVQPIFRKIDSTFVSKFLSSTCWGVPVTSKHSLLESWAFAQHWRSIVTILLQSSLFTRLVTTSSAWILAKLSLTYAFPEAWRCYPQVCYFAMTGWLDWVLSSASCPRFRLCIAAWMT